jgi:hypothetical protein
MVRASDPRGDEVIPNSHTTKTDGEDWQCENPAEQDFGDQKWFDQHGFRLPG